MKKNSEDMMIEGRHQIAKNRTIEPIKVVGLNMRDTILKAECLYAGPGVWHLLRYYDGTPPRIIERYLQELLTEDFPKDDDSWEETD